jgi:hypothetical protein
MSFKPIPDRTRWEGLLVAVWILLADGLFLVWALRRPTDWLKFGLILLVALSGPVLLYVLYRTWAAFGLEYWVDRNAITIRWANVRHVIPMIAIRQLIDGGISEVGRPRWHHWPLPWVRRAQAPGLPNVLLCATRPLEECLLVDTGDAIFALSPQWRNRFIEQLQESYQIGPALVLNPRTVQAAVARPWLGYNGIALLLLGIGLIGVLALFGRLMIEFPSLPSPLTFRYTAEGLPEVVRDKSSLFVLPGIGLLAWLINGLWGLWMMMRKQRTGAYMLWSGAILVQLFSLMALNSLLP